MLMGGIDGCFFPLCEQHSTQSEPAYCGISSLVISLNALAIDPKRSWRGSLWRWYDESMLNCCVDLNQVKTTGITLGTFKCLAFFKVFMLQ
jgi:glutathione gamma-glutamylcysteinyltransferase